jgi:3,4-dihydroxy 2-butanone 4-phosphate synthase
MTSAGIHASIRAPDALPARESLRAPAEEIWHRAVEQLASGGPVIVAAHGCTALVYGAYSITTAQMADLIRRSSGFVQVALPDRRCDALLLPEAAPTNRDRYRSGYGQCVTVDAATAVTTGISAEDRAHTARVLCAPTTTATDLTRPGHVVPVRAEIPTDPHTTRLPLATAVLALTRQALPLPGAAYAELVSEHDPLHPIQPDEARRIADQMHTVVVPI